MGVPEKKDYVNILHLLQQYRHYRGEANSVIHDSEETGRTGTFLVLDSISQEIDKGVSSINIMQCIVNMGIQRPGLVRTPEQLIFIYQWLDWYLEEMYSSDRKVSVVGSTLTEVKHLLQQTEICSGGSSNDLNVFDEKFMHIVEALEENLRSVKNSDLVNGECWAKYNNVEHCLSTIIAGVVRARPVFRMSPKDIPRRTTFFHFFTGICTNEYNNT